MIAYSPSRLVCIGFAAALALMGVLVSGCANTGGVGRTIPYKPDVVQGNFVSKEQVEALRPGQSRAQLRQLLGTPLVTSLFHGDRWDYIFTLKRPGVPAQSYRLTLFFKGEALERFEGDAMPSESEFVLRIDSGRAIAGKPPVLQASEEALSRFPPARASVPAGQTPSSTEAVPANYPPLEPPGR